MNDSNIPWKHVWITGASSGLGEQAALILANMGCSVSISARSEDKLNDIAAKSDRIAAYPADVTNPVQLKAVVAEAESSQGPIDLAIFCAGAWFPGSIEDLEVDNFARTMNVNVNGVIYALDAVLPQMLSRGKGHVSWISSVAGYGGLPNSAAYGASKAALINLAESVKPELSAKGIDVSVINPGFVQTPMTAKNDFPMPFLMKAEDGGKAMVDGLVKKKFEITFPWQLVRILKTLNLLPYSAYFWVVRNFVLRK